VFGYYETYSLNVSMGSVIIGFSAASSYKYFTTFSNPSGLVNTVFA